MRHKLYLDSPTQVGKNRITLPSALANYYGNTAQAYVNGRQVLSKTELDGTDYKTTFVTPTPVREIEIGRGNLELADTSFSTQVIDFDGSNDNMSIPAAAIPEGSEITIEFWINCDNAATNNTVFLDVQNSTGGRVLHIALPYKTTVGNIYYDVGNGISGGFENQGFDRIYCVFANGGADENIFRRFFIS
jgi:hypothetical protein